MLINQTQIAEASAAQTAPAQESASTTFTPAATTAPTTTESAPATAAPVATTVPATAESAPTTPESKPAESPTDNALRAQVEALHAELQVWKLRSSMSERHIVPQDFDLVSRLVLESAQASGKAIDQCVSDLYSSKPYLFKIPKEQTKTVENKSQAIDNKKLIESAIARLSRAKVSL